MSRSTRQSDRPNPVKYLNTPIHPQLQKQLRIEAIDKDTSIPEILHAMLCERYARPDLAGEVPETAKAALAS